MTLRLEIPHDEILGDALSHVQPATILNVCKEQLVAEDAAVRESWKEARVIEALYHPGRYAVITYALLSDPSIPDQRMWPESDLIYLRLPVREPMSRRGVSIRLGDTDVEIYRFPNDRRLRGLRKFAGAKDAIRIWQAWIDQSESPGTIDASTLQRLLVRYVPEQKWIARLRTEVTPSAGGEKKKMRVAIRFASSESCQCLLKRHQGLVSTFDRQDDFRVPKIIGADIEQGVLGVEWNRGKSLVESIREGDSSELLSGLARALHAFHQADVSDLKPLTCADQATRIQTLLEELGSVRPLLKHRLSTLADEIGRRLLQITPTQRVTLHNDFHWNQVLIKRGVYTIIDLERMMTGDPLVDVANIVTQIRLLADRPEVDVEEVEARQWANDFIEHWQRTSGKPIDPDRFQVYAVCSMMNLAYGMMRHFRPGWPALLDGCVERAEAQLASVSKEVLA